MPEFDIGQFAWPGASFLGRLTPSSRDRLMRLGYPVSLRERQQIVRQGDESDHVFLMLAGYAKIVACSANGQHLILAVRMAGDLLGELGVISGMRRSATAIACGDVQGIRVPGERFTNLVRQSADVGLAVSEMIGDRLRRSNLWRMNFQSYAAHARTARVLIEVTEAYPHGSGSGLALPLSQPELASMAGIKLRTLEKELTMLERRGAIRRRYKDVQVIDMGRLYEAAEFPTSPH